MSKPNLPALPYSLLETLTGEEIDEVRAYAEEAVRQAQAAQVPVLTDAMILHRWDTHVGELSAGTTIEDSDKIAFARAVLMESASGHNPAPVDTSPGHSAPVAGEATDAELDKLYRETITEGPEDDTQLWENPHRFYARAVLSRYAAPQARDQEA